MLVEDLPGQKRHAHIMPLLLLSLRVGVGPCVCFGRLMSTSTMKDFRRPHQLLPFMAPFHAQRGHVGRKRAGCEVSKLLEQH